MKWKQIEGYENYSISDTGLVMNTKSGRLLKPKNTYDGYCEVRIYKDKNNSKYVRVHRLVALAFVPNPDDLETIVHINGNKKDNRVENLRWLSRYAAQKKPIKCLENGVVYESITQAGEELGLKRTSIQGVLSGKRQSLHGFHFEYYKGEEIA